MAAYFNHFVASIISTDGKILRELNRNGKRTVLLPFGAEYKIRLRNKNNTRCKVEVDIDGTDVLFGSSIVLKPYKHLDLERFLSDNCSGSKFKFVSLDTATKTGQLNDPDNADNGHIRIKFYRELVAVSTYNNILRSTQPITSNVNYLSYCNTTLTSDGINPVSGTATLCSTNSKITCTDTCSFASATMDWMEDDTKKGVTVEGAMSNQTFVETDDFITDTFPTVIDIWLQGNTKKPDQNSIFSSFILPAFEKGASDIQIKGVKDWLSHEYVNKPEINSVFNFLVFPILENKNSSLEDKNRAKAWLSTLFEV